MQQRLYHLLFTFKSRLARGPFWWAGPRRLGGIRRAVRLLLREPRSAKHLDGTVGYAAKLLVERGQQLGGNAPYFSRRRARLHASERVAGQRV